MRGSNETGKASTFTPGHLCICLSLDPSKVNTTDVGGVGRAGRRRAAVYISSHLHLTRSLERREIRAGRIQLHHSACLLRIKSYSFSSVPIISIILLFLPRKFSASVSRYRRSSHCICLRIREIESSTELLFSYSSTDCQSDFSFWRRILFFLFPVIAKRIA